MSRYIDSLNDEVKSFLSILSSDFPEWLNDYIETPELKRTGQISMNCGTDYTKLYNNRFFYSNLDHSIGVALIIWNFTKDKKQTIAGLLHDIATPTFKHCIDFMNGDSVKQESTEEKTEDIIINSKSIMKLLERDGIDITDVVDYKIYPIADNNTPRLAADRFEYNFSGGLSFKRVWELDKIKKCYENVIILINEDELPELGFKDLEIALEYIETVSKLWPEWITDRNRVTMQFIADIVKSMNVKGYITIDDLYNLSDKEVIEKITNCEDNYIRDSFIQFQNIEKIVCGNEKSDKYCISVNSKKRYIDPLVKTKEGVNRLSAISNKGKEIIQNYLNINNSMYVGLDIDFKPYEFDVKKLEKK